MFPKENTLTKKRDFDLVMKYGRWISGPDLGLKVLELARVRQFFPQKEDPDNFEKQLRLAISVGLRISKKAVDRNRLKRQIREIVRPMLVSGALRGGFYIMIVPQPRVIEKNFAEISDEIKLLFSRAKLLQGIK